MDDKMKAKCYRLDYNELGLSTLCVEKDKEIERLKSINEEHRILNGELRRELEVEKDISDGMLKTIGNYELCENKMRGNNG